MRRVRAQLKAALSRYLERVKAGHEILVTDARAPGGQARPHLGRRPARGTRGRDGSVTAGSAPRPRQSPAFAAPALALSGPGPVGAGRALRGTTRAVADVLGRWRSSRSCCPRRGPRGDRAAFARTGHLPSGGRPVECQSALHRRRAYEATLGASALAEALVRLGLPCCPRGRVATVRLLEAAAVAGGACPLEPRRRAAARSGAGGGARVRAPRPSPCRTSRAKPPRTRFEVIPA